MLLAWSIAADAPPSSSAKKMNRICVSCRLLHVQCVVVSNLSAKNTYQRMYYTALLYNKLLILPSATGFQQSTILVYGFMKPPGARSAYPYYEYL